MKTAVIFRKFKHAGDVIAIFPEIPADLSGGLLSYQHLGQHGACSPRYTGFTEPAKPAEYAGLLEELRTIGYDPAIATRATAAHRAEYRRRLDIILQPAPEHNGRRY